MSGTGVSARLIPLGLTLALVAPFLGGCVEELDITESDLPVEVGIDLLPVQNPELANTPESQNIHRVHLRVVNVNTGEELTAATVELGGGDVPGRFGIRLDVDPGAEVTLEGTLELVHVLAAAEPEGAEEVESVEWAGWSGPVAISPEQDQWEVEVELGRGNLAEQEITSLEVTPSDVMVGEGEEFGLQAEVTGGPEGARVFWASQDPEIATVDSQGRVRGVAVGETQIVAVAGLHRVDVDVEVVEDAPPPPGRDVVVINDMNHFDNTAMENPNNVLLVQNLVEFSTDGSRDDGTVIWIDRGRGAVCYGTGECDEVGWGTAEATMEEAGFTVESVFSTEGSLTEIPGDVKVIILVMPAEDYTVDEVNALKAFAEEGGRIIVKGEWEGYYEHIHVQNQLLENMGAVLWNTGGAVDCGYTVLPEESIRAHPITQGLTDLTVACASTMEPGPGDHVLFYDTTNTYVIGGVAAVDTTPISELTTVDPMPRTEPVAGEAPLDPASSTGHR